MNKLPMDALAECEAKLKAALADLARNEQELKDMQALLRQSIRDYEAKLAVAAAFLDSRGLAGLRLVEDAMFDGLECLEYHD